MFIKKIKGFVKQHCMVFKEDYFRCDCGALLTEDDYSTGEHVRHRSMYAPYITFTEFVWIKWREWRKYGRV